MTSPPAAGRAGQRGVGRRDVAGRGRRELVRSEQREDLLQATRR